MPSSIARLLVAVALALVAQSLPSQARAQARPRVACQSCLLVDDLGRVLFQRQSDMRLPNASTTKMLTALVALQQVRLDEIVTVSPTAAAPEGGPLDLQPGERYDVRELLHAMLLASSNDAAVALSEHAAGSERAFVDEMNAYGRKLGLRGTHFVTSHGLDRPGHYSTARDLTRIAFEVLEHPILAEMVRAKDAVIAGERSPVAIQNRNLLLGSYPGAIGVKTGHTARAGYVLVAAAQRQGRRVVSVAMRSPDAFEDSRRLLDYGFARLRRSMLVKADAVIGAMIFDSFGAATMVAGGSVRTMAHPDDVRYEYEAKEDLVFPLLAHERVGTLRVLRGKRVIGSVDAFVRERVPDYGPSLPTRFFAALLGSFGRVLGGLRAT